MKQFVLLLSFLTLSVAASAQLGTCMPDPAYADSVGVYPLPYYEGENGIPDTACINTEYQTTFTIIVDTITLQGVSAVPDFIQIDSVVGLPEGLTYQCDPADCKYLPPKTNPAALNEEILIKSRLVFPILLLLRTQTYKILNMKIYAFLHVFIWSNLL